MARIYMFSIKINVEAELGMYQDSDGGVILFGCMNPQPYLAGTYSSPEDLYEKTGVRMSIVGSKLEFNCQDDQSPIAKLGHEVCAKYFPK